MPVNQDSAPIRDEATSETTPTISVGLAVRNGVNVLERCIGSVLSQDLADLELVISDNVSDDGTPELLAEYARADSRIRLSANRENIGSQVNMNRVLEQSRGVFFRWISADDWLEPGCLSACVGALEGRDDAIGVTTYFTIHTEGASRYEQFHGEFPTSKDPARRFERMLWFFHAGDAKYDPIYGVYRREGLMRSQRLRPSEQTDWLLCAELALMAPILHVERRLANRTRSYPLAPDRAAFRRRLDTALATELESSARRLYQDLLALVAEADLTEAQRRRCKRALRRFWVRDVISRGRSRAATARHRLLAR
jgi:glycosyltransferase involved in cell wall biosynthesis